MYVQRDNKLYIRGWVIPRLSFQQLKNQVLTLTKRIDIDHNICFGIFFVFFSSSFILCSFGKKERGGTCVAGGEISLLLGVERE